MQLEVSVGDSLFKMFDSIYRRVDGEEYWYWEVPDTPEVKCSQVYIEVLLKRQIVGWIIQEA